MGAEKIDPELIRQLELAKDAPVGAVLHLRPGPKQKFFPPEETEASVKRLLQRVEKESGIAPQQFNVFRNLGSFVVSAAAPFVRKLLDQDEILSATANRQSEEFLIKPVSSKPVKGPVPGTRKHK